MFINQEDKVDGGTMNQILEVLTFYVVSKQQLHEKT